jgi:hypothetical protein
VGTKTGNPATIIPSTGSPAPEGADPVCVELDRRNQENRQRVVDGLREKPESEANTTALRKARTSGMAFASAKVGRSTISASSSAAAKSVAPSLSDGGSSAQKGGTSQRQRKRKSDKAKKERKDAKTLCGGFNHPGGGAGAHAEAKVFNQLSNRPGGLSPGTSVVIKVDWRYSYNGRTYLSGMPCRHCFKMMCHAVKECEIELHVCDANGKLQKFTDDEDCDRESDNPDDSPMSRFDEQMGEHPLKGCGRIAAIA